jgi:acylphosphatase
MALYEIKGTVNRHTDGTVGVILERDPETDAPTRWIDPEHPEDLSKEEVDQLQSQGLVLESVTKTELKERGEDQQQVGPTPAAAAPVIEGDVGASDKSKSR